MVDGGARLRRAVDQHLGRAGEGARTVDDAGQHHPRPERLAGVPLVLEVEQVVGVVAEVAAGGHAGREIEQAVAVAQVLVHVPEAGEEHAAVGLDDLGAGRPPRPRRRAPPPGCGCRRRRR